jgi:TfoX/Sxy family transcriptional regulator of competence genes
MKKSLIQKLGLLGIVSFLSYTAAVVFAPLAYPGYNWLSQAVSDLSAANAPSLSLWNQLSALYNACEVVCVTIVCIGILLLTTWSKAITAQELSNAKSGVKMASSKEYLHFILEQLSDLDDISYRPMMGEFILYYRGKIVGGIYDDRLLVKKTKAALELMPAAICEIPYEGAKEMLLMDEVDSKEFLAELFEAMYEELPMPKRRNNGMR